MGSGTANAAGGRHFSRISPRSAPAASQEMNAGIDGLDVNGVKVIQYKPRNADGVVEFAEAGLAKDVRGKVVKMVKIASDAVVIAMML